MRPLGFVMAYYPGCARNDSGAQPSGPTPVTTTEDHSPAIEVQSSDITPNCLTRDQVRGAYKKYRTAANGRRCWYAAKRPTKHHENPEILNVNPYDDPV